MRHNEVNTYCINNPISVFFHRKLFLWEGHHLNYTKLNCFINFILFFDGLECFGHSFAYVTGFVFLRAQRAAVARGAENLWKIMPMAQWTFHNHHVLMFSCGRGAMNNLRREHTMVLYPYGIVYICVCCENLGSQKPATVQDCPHL
jgi:hypothetical protein